MKKCTKCNILKCLREFSKNIRNADGLQFKCKLCCKQYREDNKVKNSTKQQCIKSLKCNKCLKELSTDNFSQKHNSPRGFDYWCLECRKTYTKNYRLNNVEKYRNYTNKHRSDRVNWIQKIKTNVPCADCGNVYEPYCMDFDHLFDKINDISRMVLDNTPKETILKEIEKCELVCCLCHNLRTTKRITTNKYNKYALRNIEIINFAKSKPCYICGKERDTCNMQLDHIDKNEKYKDVCKLKNFKVETLLKEIAKCKPICALCHRKKSIEEQKCDKHEL